MTENASNPDRYVSFEGIDCDGDSRRVLAAVSRHLADPERSNQFWEAFKVKMAEAENRTEHKPDELRLVCSYIYYIEELFEEQGDEEGLELLHRLEEQCC